MHSVKNKTTVANWGNYPKIEAEVFTPLDVAAAQDYIGKQAVVTLRGNGKCYGDAALGSSILSTLAFDQILSFDAVSGMISCESGVLLHSILQHTLPHGWFFHVTPGIKFITVGGAIASDVHGKNHPTAGCFSNWLISFDLMLADGSVITCSKTNNADIFWQTCGGMGWTGLVLRATFQLRKIKSNWMEQKTLPANNIDELFSRFDHSTAEYNAAWMDCTATKSDFGRGVLYANDHQPFAEQTAPMPKGKPSINIPFYFPFFALNAVTIKAYNWLLFARSSENSQTISIDNCFYPLDSIGNWNRLYGRRGFIQYQFCLPEKIAFDGMRNILEAVQKSGDTPFLSVLKKHGERPAEAIHSFPIKGYSLALDFPRTKTIFSLVKKLDAILESLGGKIYLAKDAASEKMIGRVNPDTFGDMKFSSLLKERIKKTSLHGK